MIHDFDVSTTIVPLLGTDAPLHGDAGISGTSAGQELGWRSVEFRNGVSTVSLEG